MMLPQIPRYDHPVPQFEISDETFLPNRTPGEVEVFRKGLPKDWIAYLYEDSARAINDQQVSLCSPRLAKRLSGLLG